jgi:hypothetical protein
MNPLVSLLACAAAGSSAGTSLLDRHMDKQHGPGSD